MPLRRRRQLLPLLLLLLPSALVAGWLLYARTPPAIARLLPESEAILYADLRPLRLATHLDQNLPPRSPDYQRFVDSTGIVPERDLDQAAFALTRRPDPAGPNGPVAWTEVLAGRFDAPRLEQYLATLARSTETYAGHTLFLIPTGPDRTLRVTVLRPGLLALSNAPTPEQIHLVLDHSRSPLLFAPTPSLLAAHFAQIPRLSTAWAIGRIGLPFADSGRLSLFGLDLPIPADQPVVASLRFLGALRLRVDLLTPSPDTALQQSGALAGLLAVARTLAQPATTPATLLQTLNSVQITPEGSRATLTATLPLDLLRTLAPTH